MDGKYKRILLKMSGEALAGEKGRGIDFDFTGEVCKAVKQCVEAGVQVSVVVGGGNYWRGGKDGGDRMVRARADYMGMLATAMNSVALVDALEKAGVEAVIQASFGLERIAEPFNRDAAIRHLKAGRVVIFACGSGEPFFTTDTAAVLRALDIEADVLLLGKNVDGLYSADPKLGGAAPGPEGHGRGRHPTGHGKQAAPLRLRPQGPGEHRPGRRRGSHRYDRGMKHL